MQYAGLGITKTKKIIFLTNKKRRLGGGHLKLNYTVLSDPKGSEESQINAFEILETHDDAKKIKE